MFSIVAVEVGIKRPGYVFLCEVSSPLLAAKKFTPSVHNPRINSLVKKARRTLRREPQGGMHHWSKACRPLAATTNTTKPMMCRPTNLIAGYRKKKKNSSRKSNPHDTWKWCYLFHSLLNWSKKIHGIHRDVPKIEMFGNKLHNAVSCFKGTCLNLTVYSVRDPVLLLRRVQVRPAHHVLVAESYSAGSVRWHPCNGWLYKLKQSIPLITCPPSVPSIRNK